MSSQTALALVGMALGVGALAIGFPEQAPPVWQPPGLGVSAGSSMIALLLPTAILVIDRLLLDLHQATISNEPRRARILGIHDALMLRVAAFVTGLHAFTLAGAMGLLQGEAWTARVVPIMLGLTFVTVGNLLPRTPPNIAIGVPTRRTLENSSRWTRVHRRVGYLVVTAGIVLVICAIAVPIPVGSGMVLLVGPATLVGISVVVRQVTSAAHA